MCLQLKVPLGNRYINLLETVIMVRVSILDTPSTGCSLPSHCTHHIDRHMAEEFCSAVGENLWGVERLVSLQVHLLLLDNAQLFSPIVIFEKGQMGK